MIGGPRIRDQEGRLIGSPHVVTGILLAALRRSDAERQKPQHSLSRVEGPTLFTNDFEWEDFELYKMRHEYDI